MIEEKNHYKTENLRGIGLSTYIEACSGGGPEEATIILENTGDSDCTHRFSIKWART